MKAVKGIAILVVIFVVLIIIAYRFDEKNSVDKREQEIAQVDQEMKVLEKKAVSQLKILLPDSSPTKALINSYEQITTGEERVVAFQKLIDQGQSEVVGLIDASDPLKRRVLDEFTGALNRLRIVEEHHAKLIQEREQ